jgi:hypothetical protein
MHAKCLSAVLEENCLWQDSVNSQKKEAFDGLEVPKEALYLQPASTCSEGCTKILVSASSAQKKPKPSDLCGWRFTSPDFEYVRGALHGCQITWSR